MFACTICCTNCPLSSETKANADEAPKTDTDQVPTTDETEEKTANEASDAVEAEVNEDENAQQTEALNDEATETVEQEADDATDEQVLPDIDDPNNDRYLAQKPTLCRSYLRETWEYVQLCNFLQESPAGVPRRQQGLHHRWNGELQRAGDQSHWNVLCQVEQRQSAAFDEQEA